MTFAFPLEPFRESAAFALYAFANLPQRVGSVCCMLLGERCINAAAVQEVVEKLFIDPFMDGLVAFGALQVASGLLWVMNIRGGRMFLLELE